MSNISEATNDDWLDFWYYEDQMISDFEKVWKEMDQIEPLTPITHYYTIPKKRLNS